MDNIAHTLAGLALAECGLKRRTALGTATLAIAANLPDVDALMYFIGDGPDSLAFRRGWTHGPIAMIVLPALLTAVMIGWSRISDKPGRRHTPVNTGWLFMLALVGVLSHPLLDLMNTYGVRLLMPFSPRWFYGDALFIVDPWLWMLLGIGVLLSRWRARRIRDASAGVAHRRLRSSRELPTDERWVTRPALVALALFVTYAGAMLVSARFGRSRVSEMAQGPAAKRTMVGPVPVNPFRRDVVREIGSTYEIGRFTFDAGGYSPRTVLEQGRDLPGVADASLTDDGAKFLSWSRFPYFSTEPFGDSIRVRITDARYADESGRGWASVTIVVPAR